MSALPDALVRSEWFLHVHAESERFRLTKTPDCGLGFDGWAFHPPVRLVRADLVDDLIKAANAAYPPGDYSQDMHGYAVRAALDKLVRS